MTLRKRRTDNWQMLASYTYNRAKGNSNSDGNADLQGDFLWLDPRASGMWGDQPGNIEHLFKIAGSYYWDNGLEVGWVYNWNSGLVYSETFEQYSRHSPLQVDTPYEFGGITDYWADPATVASNESDAYGTLDLRVKYTLNFGNYNTELFLDIFNVLDDQAAVRQQDLSKGDGTYAFGDDIEWVEPRRFYLGARVSF